MISFFGCIVRSGSGWGVPVHCDLCHLRLAFPACVSVQHREIWSVHVHSESAPPYIYTGKCRRLPLVPGGKGQQPAYSYDEGFAKGLILNLFIYLFICM